MIAASQGIPYTNFPPPDQQVSQGLSLPVPSVVGQSVGGATATLTAAGFSVIDGGGVFSSLPVGTVASTDPGFGSAPSGSAITIYESNGPAPVIPTTKPSTKAPVTKTPVTKKTKTPVVKPTVKAPVTPPKAPKSTKG